MKGKSLLSLAIVLAMVLAVMPFAAVRAQPETSTIAILPSSISTTVGSDFTISVNITTTAYVDGFTMTLGWNATMLQLEHNSLSDLSGSSPWMNKWASYWSTSAIGGATNLIPNLNGTGTVQYAIDLLTGNATGSGGLFTANFEALASGTKDAFIDIIGPNTQNSYLLGGVGAAYLTIPININYTDNATVHIPVPVSTSPKAVITATPATGPYLVGTLITFSGSSSTNGYASSPAPGKIAPINWTISTWYYTNGTGTYGPFHGMTINFTCTAPGSVTINLTVIAPAPAGYVYLSPAIDNNTATVTITQVTKPSGPYIDVYTARGGKDYGTPIIVNGVPETGFTPGVSDSYAPQELVTVYANVTYNGAPVANKFVEFFVYLPNNTEIASYENYTDAYGIAYENFRIPWEGTGEGIGGTQYFGEMKINGTVSIANTTEQPVSLTDEVEFYYGWLLTINKVSINGYEIYPTVVGLAVLSRQPAPLTPTPSHTDVMTVNVTACSNMVYTTLTAYVECTASDNCNVPIGEFTATITVKPALSNTTSGITHFCGYMVIPQWAYVGTGTLYIDLLNDTQFGVPYCPQVTGSFDIVYP